MIWNNFLQFFRLSPEDDAVQIINTDLPTLNPCGIIKVKSRKIQFVLLKNWHREREREREKEREREREREYLEDAGSYFDISFLKFQS